MTITLENITVVNIEVRYVLQSRSLIVYIEKKIGPIKIKSIPGTSCSQNIFV
jgi:hypothetical protein